VVVKNKDQDKSFYENDIKAPKSAYLDDHKTTNINILLNRVRQDKKKSLRKKLLFTTILLTSIVGLVSYLLI